MAHYKSLFMAMSRNSQIMAGVTFLTVPSIIYGGYFLLTVLSGQHQDMQLTEFQAAMFRAGHAHAGVLVILSLVAFLYVDHTGLSEKWRWVVRICFPLAAIFISGGFFASAIGEGRTTSSDLIIILYTGVLLLIISLITIGVGLLKRNS
jgi:hypothetical protein